MKNLLLLLAVLICSANCLQAQSAADIADMQAFARNFETAYNQENTDAIREMYTEYAVRIDQEGNEMVGAAKIAAFFAKQFKDNNATLKLNQIGLNWSDRENAWVADGTFALFSNTCKFDFEVPETGEYSNVMVENNGQWKIARSVLTPLVNQPLASFTEKSY